MTGLTILTQSTSVADEPSCYVRR